MSPTPARRPDILRRLQQWARGLKRDVLALALAARDPRTPWYAKAVALAVVAYALSPIDLIPDFIPLLGYLDDLILLPLGIALALRLIPPNILAEHRRTVLARGGSRPTSRAGAILIIGVWLALAGAAALWLIRQDAACQLLGRWCG